MTKTIAAVLLGTLIASPIFAAKSPRPGPVDSRIKSVVYNPRDVVHILGHYGYQTLLQFADYERIENVTIGDSLAWQVIPNERANLIFLKPVELNAQTNLTVVTSFVSADGSGVSQRVYVFALDAHSHDDHDSDAFTWTVRFQYPEYETRRLILEQERRNIAQDAIVGRTGTENGIDPADWNFNYTFSGDRQQVPVKIFDNGTFTYFEFDSVTETPAIFLVGKDRRESLVNSVRQGRYVVVHRIGRQFTFRNGDVVTCIYNEAYSGEPELDQGSPVERSEWQRQQHGTERIADAGS